MKGRIAESKPNVGTAQPVTAPQTTDEFDAPALGLQWQWNANHEDDWASLKDRSSYLRLQSLPRAADSLQKAPNLLCQKFPARAFSVETEVELEPGAARQGGMIVLGESSHAALAFDARA